MIPKSIYSPDLKLKDVSRGTYTTNKQIRFKTLIAAKHTLLLKELLPLMEMEYSRF